MRKKYLSALLFGALLFASAGTFTSCKDYDDDINNLQGQIDANADAIKALQDLVGDGKFVSAVSNNGNTITFTFTDGTTQAIALEDEVGSVVTVNADGVLCIDGDPTDIKVAADPTPGEEHKDQIIIENNMWSVLQEDGTYKSTNIPVSGVTVSGSEADGYTFTIYAADGTSQSVELPSAASAITEMTLGETTLQAGSSYEYEGAPITTSPSDVLISYEIFDYQNLDANITNFKASDWKGNKKLPNDGDYIYASPTSIDLRIDPVDVPANNLQFYLTNTKNEDLKPIVLTASASQDSNNPPMGTQDINSRAAVTGNGLWTLYMANQTVAKNDHAAIWGIIEDAETNSIPSTTPGGTATPNPYVYALNANHGFRSEYDLTVKRIDPEELNSLNMVGVNEAGTAISIFTTSGVHGTYDTKTSTSTTTFKVGVPYRVNAVQESALYDMYLTADDSDVKVYGLTFNQDAHTFTIGKNPDVSTVPADFDLIVYTVANDGTVNKATITVRINTEISAATEYQLQTHNVNKKVEDNHFGIDLSTMKTALGDKLDQWMQNVDLTKFENAAGRTAYQLYSNEACTDPVSINGIEAFVVEKLDENTKVKTAGNTGDRNKTNYIQVNVANNQIAQLQLGKTYYFKASFYNDDSQILNSIVVPVTFTAPTLAEQFVKESAVFVNGGNLAMAYMNVRDQRTGTTDTGAPAYSLKNAFASMPTDATINANVQLELVDNDGLYDNTESSKSLAGLGTSRPGSGNITCADDVKIYLNTAKPMNDGTGRPLGYGQDLTIKATDAFYGGNGLSTGTTGWKYAGTDGEYTFQIRVMSPIFEGTVTAIGDVVEIEASDIVNGYKMGNEDIAGVTYNNVPYAVLPDKVPGTTGAAGIASTADWEREDIKGVSAKSLNTRVVTVGASKQETADAVGAEQDKDGKKVADGYILVFPESIAETTQATVNVNVTDIWGYTKTNPITVQVNVGE